MTRGYFEPTVDQKCICINCRKPFKDHTNGHCPVTVDGDNAHEYECHKWSTEASDLGLPVGRWPLKLRTTLGNGMDFLLKHSETREGDVLWVDYLQGNGCISLRVYND